MDITVCICTRDRAEYLRDCLDGLRQQTVGGDRFDILVVDCASTGDVPAQVAGMVAAIADARLVWMQRPGVSHARNAGAAAARGAYIAYIDDDAIPAADWVGRILAAIAERDPPPALLPRGSTRLNPCRWRLAHAAGFARAALGPGLAPGG